MHRPEVEKGHYRRGRKEVADWIDEALKIFVGIHHVKDYVDDQLELKADKSTTQDALDQKADKSDLNQYITSSDANRTYLKDGQTTNKLMITRTGGGSEDSLKVTAVTGGATIWRLDCKDGKGGSTKYMTEAEGTHDMIVKKDSSLNYTASFGWMKYSFAAGADVEYKATDAHYFKNTVVFSSTNGTQRLKLTNSHADFYSVPRFQEGFVVKAAGQSIGGDNVMNVSPNYANYQGRISQDTDLVNKKYVDDKVGSAASVEAPQPAQQSWVFEGDRGTDNHAPRAGFFRKTVSSGRNYIRFSFDTNKGVNLGFAKFPDENVVMEYGPIGSIWRNNASKTWQLIKQFRVESWRWNFKASGDSDAHFEVRTSSEHGYDWDALEEGVEYYITVGGLF